MKAFLFSDIHGSTSALNRIVQFINQDGRIELLLFAGDFLNSGRPVSFTIDFIRALKEVKLPFLWVSGNNDFGEGYDQLNNSFPSLEGREESIGGWRFTGVAGSPLVWDGDSSSNKVIDREKLAGSIFLGHYPPPGRREYVNSELDLSPIPPSMENPKYKSLKQKNGREFRSKNDLALGSETLGFPDAFRLAYSPLLHICGHLHNQEGLAYLGETKVVKLGAAAWGRCALLDLETLTVEFVRL